MIFLRAINGVLYSCLSALLLSAGDLLIFGASQAAHPLLIYVFNANIGLLLCIIIFCIRRPKIEYYKVFQHVCIIILCGLLQTLGHITVLLSIMVIGPGNAVTLYYTMPIFAIFLSYLFAKTDIRGIHILFTLFSIAGVVFTSRSFGKELHTLEIRDDIKPWIGGPAALAAAFSHAGSIVVRRKLQEHEINSLVCTLSFLLQYSLVSLAFCSIYGAWHIPDNGYDVAMLLAIGATGFFGTFFLYLGVASVEHPATVSIIITLGVPLVYIGQIVLFDIPFQWTSFTGALLICCSCVGVALQSLIKRDQEQTGESEDGQQLLDSK